MSVEQVEIEWGFDTAHKRLVFTATTEMDGKPYSYSKGFSTAVLRFAADRDAAVRSMANETVSEMSVDLARLRATFESRGTDRKADGSSYHK